ncbi:MAG: MBL fold metallo-hydrolase, partial [Candidatus Thorarchaeota archaeon]
IIPGLYLLPGSQEGRFPFSHSFLVEGETRAIIDTGAGIQRLQRLQQQTPVDLVISSHSHPDHTAGNWIFDGLPLHAPEQAAVSFGRLQPLSERFVEPGRLSKVWRKFVRQTMYFRDAPHTDTFCDGATFDLGRVTLVAIHTPGHVLDHYCFFEPNQGVLFSFDIDLTSFGPWYGHRESNIGEFEKAIRRVIALKPKLIVSSHKGIIENDIQSRLNRFLAVFDERDAKIRRLLTAGYTANQMVELSPFYGGHPFAPEILRYWEQQMILKHLERLTPRRLQQ